MPRTAVRCLVPGTKLMPLKTRLNHLPRENVPRATVSISGIRDDVPKARTAPSSTWIIPERKNQPETPRALVVEIVGTRGKGVVNKRATIKAEAMAKEPEPTLEGRVLRVSLIS